MWKIRKPIDLPREEKIALAELKRITSSLKLDLEVEVKAKEIYNSVKLKDTKKGILVSVSVFIACKKLNVEVSNEKFEEATRMKIDEVKDMANNILKS
jgi:transcription initiation factor TFIIIB Brf1 subunit/transcription initiation factor TFIIB